MTPAQYAEIFGDWKGCKGGSFVIRDGKAVERHKAAPLAAGPQVMRDHPPIKSSVTGKVIDGRRDRREHNARNHVRDVDPSEHHREYHNPRFAAKAGVPLTPRERWDPQVVADHNARLPSNTVSEYFRRSGIKL